MKSQDWRSLLPAITAAGADPESCLDDLRRYAEQIVRWNTSVSNLMSRNDHSRIVERHLRESLEPARWLKDSGAEKWIDFGSGAGFPAIPLAIAGVGREWLLVDSRRAKVLFLKRVVIELLLHRVEAVHARLEAIVEDERNHGAFDALTSRATALLPETLLLAAPLVKPGGFAFLWKGSRRDEEMVAGGDWQKDWSPEGILSLSGGNTAVCKFVRK